MGIKVIGLEALEKRLKFNVELADVKKVVRQNTAKLDKAVKKKVPVDTRYLKRSVGLKMSDGGFTGTVGATAEYAPYLEYGTRFMRAQPFMKPSLDEVGKQFKADMDKLTI
jgi:HK97 gp10 family phage protein